MIRLFARDFRTSDGEVLPNWREVDALALDATERTGPVPVYTGFTWRVGATAGR